jgi:adenosylcobinamide-GDP ribazoletransferase
MRHFFIALQFLTIIPLPFTVRCEEKDLGRAMAFFPLVGLVIGGGLAGVNHLLGAVIPSPLRDLLLVTALTVATGALHLDGLADVCDGIAARGSRERFLAVMKDSRIGAVGAVALILSLLLKYQALALIPGGIKHAVLFLFPMIARFSQVQMAIGARRARTDGLGAAFAGGVGMTPFGIAAVTAVAAAWYLLELRGVLCILLSCLLTWLLRGWSHRRLGGITGDVIGCVSELNEIAVLLAMLVLLKGPGIS